MPQFCCLAEGLRQISFQLQKLGMKDEPAYDDLRALLEVITLCSRSEHLLEVQCS